MRAHLWQKLLPLTLCFALGVGLSAASESVRRAERRSERPAAATVQAHSRTWLVIKSRPTLLDPFVARDVSGLHALQLRVRFGVDGKVSQVIPLAESLPEELVAHITEATERIRFIPATEDGSPLAVIADVTHEVKALCGCGNDMLDNGRCDGGYLLFPKNLNVRVISVEGAKDPEGWRVVYE